MCKIHIAEFMAYNLKKGGLAHMARGRIKWYSAALGYGFIVPDDGATKVLVHHKDIAGGRESKLLENGAQVTYTATWGQEGLEAKNVSEI
jgi:CspA family cold shock protein